MTWGLVLTGIVLSLLAIPQKTQAFSKLSLSPASASLTEGDLSTFTLTLPEPIVASPGPGFVTINISSASSRVSIVPSSVTYAVTEWAQQRTFTVTAVDDSEVNGSAVATINMLMDSNSEFYNLFSASFTVNVADKDVATVASTTQTVQATQATLAATGSPLTAALVLGSTLITLPILLARATASTRRTSRFKQEV
jgi:hypothetical protein